MLDNKIYSICIYDEEFLYMTIFILFKKISINENKNFL